MKYIQKKGWLVWGMIFLTLLLNVLIVSASNENQAFLWVLILSIPLFVFFIYLASQKSHFRKEYFNIGLWHSVRLTDSEWLSHSVYPTKIAPTDLKVRIGNEQCSQPYSACIFNIGSMGDRNPESVFISATKESELESYEYSIAEGLKTYHLAAGGIALQIGSDYLGCRTANGNFNSKAFKIIAHKPEVKLIELQLCSSIKPIYPVDSHLSFAETGLKIDHSIFPGSPHTTFGDAEGMIHFLSNLREFSGGKPIGIRLRIKDKKEFYQICHAVRKAQIIPDFIVVEDTFERTGIVHSDQVFQTGITLYEALLFVSQTLQMYGLQNNIKVIADGKIISCFDILKILALGANVVYTEMPRYMAVKHPGDSRKLSLHFKNQDVYDFHDNLMEGTAQIMKVCGFKSVSDITLPKFFSRLDVLHSKYYDELNRPDSFPGNGKKIYNSKMKNHQLHHERKKVSIS